MKKLLIFSLTLLNFLVLSNEVFATGVLSSYKYVAKNQPNYEFNSTDSAYSQDLNRVEMYLYNKIYPRQSLSDRLNRIERTIFRQIYSSLNTSERINNILSCYQDTYNMRNYISNYYSPNPFRRMYSRYNGYPTGFTPSISPSILNNTIFPHYENGYYNNRYGYRYENMIPPMVGAAVKILD